MKKRVYVVSMHRWGDDESHNYVQGAFTKKAQAIKCGEAESNYRGLKYTYKVTDIVLDEQDEDSMNWFKNIQK